MRIMSIILACVVIISSQAACAEPSQLIEKAPQAEDVNSCEGLVPICQRLSYHLDPKDSKARQNCIDTCSKAEKQCAKEKDKANIDRASGFKVFCKNARSLKPSAQGK